MRFEVFWEKPQGAFDRGTGHGNEITETLAFIKIEHFGELFKYCLPPLSLLNLFQQGGQSVRFHPTSRALAAALASKELGYFDNLFYNARPLTD